MANNKNTKQNQNNDVFMYYSAVTYPLSKDDALAIAERNNLPSEVKDCITKHNKSTFNDQKELKDTVVQQDNS